MRRVGLIVVPDVQMINFGALSVFELANAKSGETHYKLVVMSEHGGAVRNSFGMEISTKPLAGGVQTALRSAAEAVETGKPSPKPTFTGH
jgi:transcriptional regulator GlxA family with amidase domain